MLKKDEKILARLERENKKTIAYTGARPLDIEGGDYKVCFNKHEAMYFTGDSESAPVNLNYDTPRCFKDYYTNYVSKIFSDSDNFLEITVDRGEVEAAKKLDNRQGYCKNPWIYEISGGEYAIGVNPRYMIDHLDFCKTDRCYIMKDGFNSDGIYVNAIFFISEDHTRFSLVLPINIKGYKDKKESEAA